MNQKKITDKLDEAIIEYYINLANILRGIIDYLNGVDRIISSDHGFCRYSYDINIIRILEDENFVVSKTAPARMRIKSFLKCLIPSRYKAQIRHYQNKMMKDQKASKDFTIGLNWDKSYVVPFTGLNGLYLNKKSLFNKGIVESSNEAKIIERVINYLKSIQNPITGEPIFLRVSEKKEYYHGENSELMPDILFDLSEGYFVNCNIYHKSDLILERKYAKTSKDYMPGQGHIGMHSSPAIFTYYDNEGSFNTCTIKNQKEIYDIIMQRFKD
jgi:predicted AlkP superfamily phosphohydrolase/phosphomutase